MAIKINKNIIRNSDNSIDYAPVPGLISPKLYSLFLVLCLIDKEMRICFN